MLHKPYSVLVHYPLYCGALYIIYVGLGLLVVLLVVIVHLYLLYIGRRYSHFSHHSILSYLVYSLHCVRRLLPRRGLIFIYIILVKEYINLLLSISSLFMLFMGLGCITFGIKSLSSRLASTKLVIVELSLQHFFYKDSEIKVKKSLLKQVNLSPLQN